MLNTLDIAIIGSYLAVLLFFGVWYHLRSKKSSELMDGGRNLSGWALGLSLTGTNLSSIALFSFPALAFAGNWTYFVKFLTIPIAAYVAARYLVDYFRKANHISAYAHFRERVGPWAALYAAFIFIAYQTVRIGFIMFLVSGSLSFLMDWNFQTIAIITGIVVTAYTYLGGIRAVVTTDILQSLLMLGGVIFLLVFIFFKTPASAAEILDIASTANKFNMLGNTWSLSEKGFLLFFLSSLIHKLSWRSVDQACVQRYIIAKSSTSAKRALGLQAIIAPAIALILFATGTALFVFYQTQPELLEGFQAITQIESTSILPYFIATQMPAGVIGIMIVVTLAAAMSTLDSEMNSTATLILKEIVQPIFPKPISEKAARFILSASALIQGTIAIWVGIQFSKIENVYDIFIELMSILSGGVFGLFLLVFFLKKPQSLQCLLSVIAGSLAIVWMRYAQALPETFSAFHIAIHPWLSGLVGTLATLLTGLALKPFFKNRTHA